MRLSLFIIIGFGCSGSATANLNLSTKEFSRVAQNMAARQSSVYHITSDHNGLLWLATDTDGILRHDGKQFVRWTDSVLNNVQAADFSKLLIDKNTLWAATWGHGLVAWNSAKQSTRQFNVGKNRGQLQSDRVQTLFLDRQQRLWIGTLNGLQYVPAGTSANRTDSLQFIGDDHPLNNLRIWWITESDDWIWVASSQGVFRVAQDLSNWTRYYIEPDGVGENRTNEIRTIELIGETLWAGTDHGLYYLPKEGNAFRPVQYDSPISSANLRVNDLVVETEANQNPVLWVGAGNGLYQFDLAQKSFIKQGIDWAALKNIDVRSLHLDNNNTLWVGTRGQGVFKGMTVNRNFSEPLSTATFSVAKAPIQAVHYSNDDTLWLANDKGVFRRRPETQNWVFYPFPESLGARKVDVLFTDSYGELWIGLNEALIKTSSTDPELRATSAINKHLDLDNATITAIHEMTNGDMLLGIWGRGIAYYDRSSAMFSWQNQAFDQLRGDQAYSIIDSPGSGIYSATRYSGLMNLSTEQIVAGEFNNYTLICAHATRADSIWLCSDNGIWNYNVKTGKTRHYTEADGLPSNRVLGMTSDDDENLWVITLNGLARLNTTSGKVITLGKSDGLLTSNFLEHAIDSSSTGEVTAGSLEGSITFNPDELIIKETPPNVALTSVVLDNQDITPEFALTANELSLPADFQSLQLSFSVTDYRAPENNATRYRLSGVNDVWSRWTTNSSLFLSSLTPGSYILTVDGRNSQGTESDDALKLTIIVDAPWWYSFWTLFLGLSSLMLLIYALVRARTKNLERANRTLQEQIALHTRELKVANRKLQTLSETDALTGLLNRRGFENHFHELLKAYPGADTPMSLLLIDVDHFKQFNDKFGHDAGDTALKAVSECLAECFRERDIVARWGGEEFTVALPGLNSTEAKEVAGRVRQRIAELVVSHEGQPLHLTVTIGISCFAAHTSQLQTWLRVADEALYEGKRQGRNCVMG